MYDVNELKSKLMKAHQAGDKRAAGMFANEIRKIQSQEKIQEGEYDTGLGFSVGRDSAAYEGLVGAGRAVGSMVDGAQDAYLGLTGQTAEREAHNERADEDSRIYDALAERSTAAKVGNIAGEIGMAAIPATGTAKLYKGAKWAGRLGVAAAEGGAFEAVRQRGDALERLGAGLEGGLFSAAGQGVGEVLGASVKAASGKLARRLNGGGILQEAEQSIVDAGAKATDRKTLAAEYGGFELDGVDAYASSAAATQRQALRDGGGDAASLFSNSYREQELAVLSRATALTGSVTEGARRLDGTEKGIGLAEGLQELRTEDYTGVDKLYDAWRNADGADAAVMDTSNVQKGMEGLFKRYDTTSNISGKLKALLNDYGVTIGETKGGLQKRGAEGAQKFDLTPATYEQLIQDINSVTSLNANGADKKLVGGLRSLLEDTKFETVGNGGSPELFALGEQARAGRKAFAAKWEQGDIVDKLTSKRPGTDSFRAEPVSAAKSLMRPEKFKELQEVKKRLTASTDIKHNQAWEDIKAAPLLEALEYATNGKAVAGLEGGGNGFNVNAFNAALSKFTDKQLTTLYGLDFVPTLRKTQEAWGLREFKPTFRGNLNPAGTNKALNASRALTGGGDSRAFINAIPVLRDIGGFFTDRSNKKAAERLLSGKLPKGAKKLTRKEALVKLKEKYPNPELQQFNNALNFLARTISREDDDQ